MEDAARLLRQAPAKVKAPEALPRLDNEMNFVYVYVGAQDRVLEFSERISSYGNGARNLWFPEYAPLRKTERFKAFVRKAGLAAAGSERPRQASGRDPNRARFLLHGQRQQRREGAD